jgi:hypothetical protein
VLVAALPVRRLKSSFHLLLELKPAHRSITHFRAANIGRFCGSASSK